MVTYYLPMIGSVLRIPHWSVSTSFRLVKKIVKEENSFINSVYFIAQYLKWKRIIHGWTCLQIDMQLEEIKFWGLPVFCLFQRCSSCLALDTESHRGFRLFVTFVGTIRPNLIIIGMTNSKALNYSYGANRGSETQTLDGSGTRLLVRWRSRE